MGVYRKSLAKAILFVLEKSIDGCVRLEDFAYNPGFYAYYDGWDRSLKKAALSKALKRLREGGLVEQVNLKDDVLLRLTEGGRDLISDHFEDKEWDGKWRVVIFDIPEEKRIIRNLFRRNLKKWGFKHLQKSVWFSKRDVFNKVESYVKRVGIEQWVAVMEVTRLSGCTIS